MNGAEDVAAAASVAAMTLRVEASQQVATAVDSGGADAAAGRHPSNLGRDEVAVVVNVDLAEGLCDVGLVKGTD